MLEGFILNSLKASTTLSKRQFGGKKGSGVEHFLVETWDSILTTLEDHRASAHLMSVDFEKAFNRMDHGSCLEALKSLKAKEEDIELVACFLRGRTMRVKVGEEYSEPRSVPGGSPQGSILGNYLLCACTDVFTTGDFSCVKEPLPVTNELVPPTASEQVESEEYDSDYEDGPNFRFFRTNPRRIEDNDISFRCTQQELDELLGVPYDWTTKKADIMAYIDDLNIIEKVRHSDAVSDLSVHKQISRAHAPQSELFFENISSHANSMGMKVNESKTQVVCISAAKNAVVRSYINANERITSADELKILGFWFSTTPGVSLHVQKTVKKFCKRLWSLRHLKRSGMSQDDLLFIYMSVLRPVIDFASVAYHTLLTIML